MRTLLQESSSPLWRGEPTGRKRERGKDSFVPWFFSCRLVAFPSVLSDKGLPLRERDAARQGHQENRHGFGSWRISRAFCLAEAKLFGASPHEAKA